MKYYAGLDVAMKETFICILDEDGKRLYEGVASTDPKPIYEELIKGGVELEKVGLETGYLILTYTKAQFAGMNLTSHVQVDPRHCAVGIETL